MMQSVLLGAGARPWPGARRGPCTLPGAVAAGSSLAGEASGDSLQGEGLDGVGWSRFISGESWSWPLGSAPASADFQASRTRRSSPLPLPAVQAGSRRCWPPGSSALALHAQPVPAADTAQGQVRLGLVRSSFCG